jgi:hypothetical protein
LGSSLCGAVEDNDIGKHADVPLDSLPRSASRRRWSHNGEANAIVVAVSMTTAASQFLSEARTDVLANRSTLSCRRWSGLPVKKAIESWRQTFLSGQRSC